MATPVCAPHPDPTGRRSRVDPRSPAARVGRRGVWARRAVAAVFAAIALPASAAPDVVVEAYARYLAGGRGDVEIHLSSAGEFAHASTESFGDGSYRCDVSGLRSGAAPADPTDAALALASRLIHETTHCQTSPYTSALREPHPTNPARDARPTNALREPGDAAAAAGAAADLLVALTLESIADARVVLELYRADGPAAARAGVHALLARRESSASPAHATAAALRDALAWAEHAPADAAPPQQRFDTALRIGQAAALHTVRQRLRRQGAEALADSRPLNERRTALAAALQTASRAFGAGRYDNRAATVRAQPRAVSPSDYHFFVTPGGALRTQPALGAEGAQHAAALADGLRRLDAPLDRASLQWLRCQGALDPRRLVRLSASLARVLRQFTDGSPTQTARAARVVGESLERCRPGQGEADLLDNAADLLKTAMAPH